MTSNEKWNKIVSQYIKNLNSKEEIIQSSWELLFSTLFDYEDSEIDSQRSVKMGVSTKRADIVIKNNLEDLFVVELKRHTLHEGESQLFSYLNQLKIDLGILICDNLYVYDYDYSQKDISFNHIEIPFVLDEPNGISFVELFSKNSFDKQAIKKFIKERNDWKNVEVEIKKELNSDLILFLLKQYFSSKYKTEGIENILSSYNFLIEQKSAETPFHPNLSIESQMSQKSIGAFSIIGKKDTTQYSINGKVTGGKGPTVYGAVTMYINSHPGISYEELRKIFPDHMAKPGFGKMIRRIDEVTQEEWKRSRFNKHPIMLADGTSVTVSTQWKPDNMGNFIRLAGEIGFQILPVT